MTTATLTTKPSGPGRPRTFDEADALQKAIAVFWEKGFEATSLDDLTSAMGLSRSSFYGAFGSKQELFLRALQHYSDRGLENLQAVADTGGREPLEAMMEALSNPEGGPRGCMLVNCITELAPHDPDVANLGRRHLEQIENIFARVISPSDPEAARDTASAYASLAIGTLALRKAGLPADRIARTLKQAKTVVAP